MRPLTPLRPIATRPATSAPAPATLPVLPARPAMPSTMPATTLPAMTLLTSSRPAASAPSTSAPAASRPAATLPAASRPATNLPASLPAASSREGRRAGQLYTEGLALLPQDSLVDARAMLSAALASGALSEATAADCRARLTEIAQKVVFSREIYPNDPYAYRYVVKPGDVIIHIVRREKLYVPDQGIQRINRIADPRKMRAGQWLKLVRGPFDAIVTRKTYTLDLYHHGMFVKSYRIGLGQDGRTPVGKWVVRARVSQAPWTTSDGSRIIYYGQEGYPLGRGGCWISLASADPNTEDLPGFGIHGTNEPDSIGRDASLGCIRLLDDDIEELFGLLYDGMSKVEIRP